MVHIPSAIVKSIRRLFSRGSSDQTSIWLVTLLLSLLLLKLFIIFFTNFGSEKLVLDEYTNLQYANSIKNHFSYWSEEGLAYRPPTYSLLLVIVKILAGNKIIYYKIANVLLGLGTVYLVYASLSGKRRILAACCIACFPPFFFLYDLVLAENLAIFWVALLTKIYTGCVSKRRFLNIVAFGVVSGLLVLTRPESLPYLLVAHVVLIYRERRLVISFLCLFAIVQGWMVRNYLLFQRYPLISTNAANTFYLATFPESTGTSIYSNDDIQKYPTFRKDLRKMENMTEIERYDYYLKTGLQYLKDNPSVFLRLLPVRIGTLLAPEMVVALRLINVHRFHLSDGAFMLFVWSAILWDALFWLALGIVILKGKIDSFYLTFLVGLVLTVCFVIAEARYRIQIMPALVVAVFSASPRGYRGFFSCTGKSKVAN
jgi:hypothetical protein